jgi:ABC-2 type transport system permease protein
MAQTAIGARSPAASTAGSLRKYLDEIGVFVWRDIIQTIRMPERLADVTIQPIMFVLLFGLVFGSAIPIPGGGDYHEFLIAGIFVQTLAFGAMATAIGIIGDMKEGVIDRFRTLPIARGSMILGRSIASLIEGGIALLVMSVCGLIIGWTVHNGLLQTLAGYGLLALFAFAMICVGTYIGLLVRTPGTAQAIAVATIFPLTFASNAFVPTDNMPAVLRFVAGWSPVSTLDAAVRGLFGNPNPIPPGAPWTLTHPITASLIWCAVLILVFLTLAVRRYARTRIS